MTLTSIYANYIEILRKSNRPMTPFPQTAILTHSICVMGERGDERKLFDGSDGVCFACE